MVPVGLAMANQCPTGVPRAGRRRRPLGRIAVGAALVAAALGTGPIAAAAADVTAPVLAELFFSPSTVDTSGAPAVITVTAHMTDDETGFASAVATFESPSGSHVAYATFDAADLVSGTGLDGLFESTLTIPRYAEQGTWALAYIYGVDGAGNPFFHFGDDLQAAGLSTTFEQTGSVVDLDDPALAELSFSPSTVDTSGAPALVSVTARLTDDLGGVTEAGGHFTSPSGAQNVAFAFSGPDLVSGSSLDGVYESTATVPRFAEKGTWKLDYFYAVDTVGNVAVLRLAQLKAAGLPTSLYQTGSVVDTEPPVLAELSFSPTSVDASAAPATVTLTARLTDDQAGVDYLAGWFESPSGSQSAEFSFDASTRVSGTSLDGVYEATATLPADAELGTWSLYHIYGADSAGNQVFLYTIDFQLAGLPTTIEVVATPDADLAMSVVASPPRRLAEPGHRIVYTFTSTNAGPGTALDVAITDVLPVQTGFISATPSTGGTCTTPPPQGSGTVTCDWPGATAPGDAREVRIVVRAITGPSVTNTASTTSATFDPDLFDNSATVITRVG